MDTNPKMTFCRKVKSMKTSDFSILAAIVTLLVIILSTGAFTRSSDQADTRSLPANNPDHIVSGDSLTLSVDKDSVRESSDLIQSAPVSTGTGKKRPIFSWRLKWALIAISASAIAGILVRFESTRRLKTLFLLASVVILGFYNGACPCPIQSLMDIVRIFVGKNIKWQNLIYFLGLIPVTYLFGRVYCGWICHMGALQEFIFLPSRIDLFRSYKAQKILRSMRYIFLIALLVWVAVEKSAVWCRYDPFKVAFNLSSRNITGWILLGLLLLSSLFVYRPFCRGFCPIGLILGWVTKLPGASVIGLNKCTLCMSCTNKCQITAIVRKKDGFILDNQDCVVCGDCLDACKIKGLDFYRKSKDHPGSFSC